MYAISLIILSELQMYINGKGFSIVTEFFLHMQYSTHIFDLCGLGKKQYRKWSASLDGTMFNKCTFNHFNFYLIILCFSFVLHGE